MDFCGVIYNQGEPYKPEEGLPVILPEGKLLVGGIRLEHYRLELDSKGELLFHDDKNTKTILVYSRIGAFTNEIVESRGKPIRDLVANALMGDKIKALREKILDSKLKEKTENKLN